MISPMRLHPLGLESRASTLRAREQSEFFSTPFDLAAVDFLANLEVGANNIASFEINDLALIDYACSKGKPVLISTGVTTLSEIMAAVTTCRTRRIEPILLHCLSAHPAQPSQMNLAMIESLKSTFSAHVGLSTIRKKQQSKSRPSHWKLL